MADIFTKQDAEKVVEFKTIWFVGDSNIRALYKDLIWLLQKNSLINLNALKKKLECSYMNDFLVKGELLHKGRSYTEVRCFEDFTLPTKIEFIFVTECFSNEIQLKMTNISSMDMPDIIIMNSCLWDITRWGPDSISRYKSNIKILMNFFREYLPSSTLFIWLTTPPISDDPYGGFLIKQIGFMKASLRFDVMEANLYVRQEVVNHGFDVLDIHYHLLFQLHRRRPDGIHWNPCAVRHMTNLILTHISLSYKIPLPGNFQSPILNKIICKNREKNNNDNVEIKLNQINQLSYNIFPVKTSQANQTKKNKNRRKRRRNEVLCDLLSFKEKLYVFNDDGRRIGRFSISIHTEELQNYKILIAHISNRGILEGLMSESTVTGFITTNLKTLEEFRHEWSELNSGKHERKFYLLREKKNYYWSLTQSVCEVETKNQRTIPFAKSIGLIGEASNIILMRAIAIRKYEGILYLKTILSNGKRCHNYYISKRSQQMINGVKMDVMIIYRNITDHKNYNVTMTAAFTKAGQMLYLLWSNTGCFLHVDPDLEIYGNMVDEDVKVGLHRHWNRDKQIFSYYLDRKVHYDAFIRSYRLNENSLKRIAADWLQFLLMMKPPDIICSAVQYFTAFDGDRVRKCCRKRESQNHDKNIIKMPNENSFPVL